MRRNLKLIAVVALLAAMLAYAGSYIVPPGYSASSRILVRARDARFLTASGQDLSRDPGFVDAALTKSLTQTNAGLVQSRELTERVVRELHLDAQPPAPSSFLEVIRASVKQVLKVAVAFVKYGDYREPTAFEAAVQELQSNLEAAPVKDSYLIEVRAIADAPDKAAAIANSAALGLVDLTAQRAKQDAQAYRDFLAGQVDRAQTDFVAAGVAIRTYKEQQGITDVTALIRTGTPGGSIQQQLADTEVQLKSTLARQQALEDALRGLNRTESTTSTLQTGRGSTTTTSVAPNRVYQDIVTLKLQVDADVDALQAKRTSLSSATAGGLTTSLLPSQEARLNQLDLQNTLAEETYRTIRNKYQEALITSAQGAVEVTQVAAAAPPTYPVRPLRYLFAIFGFFCGLGGGVLLAKLARSRRPSRGPVTHGGPARPISVPQPVLTSNASASEASLRTDAGPLN